MANESQVAERIARLEQLVNVVSGQRNTLASQMAVLQVELKIAQDTSVALRAKYEPEPPKE